MINFLSAIFLQSGCWGDNYGFTFYPHPATPLGFLVGCKLLSMSKSHPPSPSPLFLSLTDQKTKTNTTTPAVAHDAFSFSEHWDLERGNCFSFEMGGRISSLLVRFMRAQWGGWPTYFAMEKKVFSWKGQTLVLPLSAPIGLIPGNILSVLTRTSGLVASHLVFAASSGSFQQKICRNTVRVTHEENSIEPKPVALLRKDILFHLEKWQENHPLPNSTSFRSQVF